MEQRVRHALLGSHDRITKLSDRVERKTQIQYNKNQLNKSYLKSITHSRCCQALIPRPKNRTPINRKASGSNLHPVVLSKSYNHNNPALLGKVLVRVHNRERDIKGLLMMQGIMVGDLAVSSMATLSHNIHQLFIGQETVLGGKLHGYPPQFRQGAEVLVVRLFVRKEDGTSVLQGFPAFWIHGVEGCSSFDLNILSCWGELGFGLILNLWWRSACFPIWWYRFNERFRGYLNTKQGDNEQFYREAVFDIVENKPFYTPGGCYNAFCPSFD